MMNSFFTALSGLNANSASLSVIGNNLANMNTVGYKTTVIAFEDLVEQSALFFNGAGNPTQNGLGVKANGINTKFTQGVLQSTGQPQDLAIVGDGFFTVREGSTQAYTRAGNLTLDAAGNLLTQQGGHLQGWPVVNGVIDTNSGLVDIQIDPGSILAATQTSLARFTTNLNAEMPAGDSYTTAFTMVDSLGGEHAVTVQFTRLAPALPGDPPSYSFDVMLDGGEVVGGTAGVNFSLLTGADAAAPPGTVVFNPDGTLASVDSGGGPVAPAADFAITTPAWINGAAAQTFDVDLVDDDGAPYLSSYASPSTTSSTFQDGIKAASLLTFAVDADGTIQGVYSNGKSAPLGQLGIATFNNPQGLIRMGHNTFIEGVSSGQPSIGAGGEGGRGAITGGSLELSNVDIASEFTSLIIAQRGYQANSRVVTTTDEVLQEAINLKR